MPESKKQSTNLRQELDDNQLKAVNFGDGPALVTAGPGSGKTTVITHRILNMVTKQNIPSGKIAVITFTKAAAVEMKDRFNKLSSGFSSNVTFATFHSFFYHIILSYQNQKSLPLITEKEKRDYIKRYLKSKKLYCFDNIFIDGILKEISYVKNNRCDPKEFKSKKLEKDRFFECFDFYNNLIRLSGKIDFDDMMTGCFDILENNKDILKMWQERFDYYLIDEFQDINYLQYEIIKKLAVTQNIFVVGDEDQSIYGFRGSSPRYMFLFMKEFNAKRIDLSVNYRSLKGIVNNSNEIIKDNVERFDKTITPVSTQNGNVLTIKYNSDFLMYSDMALKIKENLSLNLSCVILQRTGKISPEMVKALQNNDISFTLPDKYTSIFDNAFCLDILSYLALANKDNRCEHLFRIINKPSRYVSSDFMAMVRERSDKDREFTFDWCDVLSLAKTKDYLYSNLFFLKNYLQKISGMRIYEAIKYIRKMIGYDDYLSNLALTSGCRFSELVAPLDEFEDFAKTIANYNDLINEIEIIKRLKINHNKGEDKDIEILTFHASKGLEWDAVFLPDLCEGVVPHKKAVSKEEIEEERRMLYVAMTRARKYLWMGTVYNKQNSRFPSSFIKL